MRKAGILAFIAGAAMLLPGCGFTEGAGATVTVVKETPTPIPTPTPEATPTPLPTPTPAVVTETTETGVVVTKVSSIYTAATDINLRRQPSADAELVTGVPTGTELTGTGECDNGWIQLSYNGEVVYASGDYLTWMSPGPGLETAAQTPAEGEVVIEG